jgi:predicted small lipoprotein YifL
VPARSEKTSARPAGVDTQGYAVIGAAFLSLLLIVVVASLTGDGDGGPTRPPGNRQENTDVPQAYEISWTEQTSRREYVEDPYVCDGVLYCENPFPSGHWETVPGPEQTRTDFVCANDLAEARMLVSPDVTVTGRVLDSDLCAFPDD